MKNCILIPTYPPHFQFVFKLLNSIEKYNTDKLKTKVYIVISKNDYFVLKCELDKCIFNKLTINVLTLEHIMESFGTSEKDTHFYKHQSEPDPSSKNETRKCDRYSFQSIKKLLSIKYLISDHNYELIYSLDSEGLFVRPFSMNHIFENYVNNKEIFFNSFQLGDSVSKLRCSNSKKILNTEHDVPGWLLENYMWIYEKKIFEKFFDRILPKTNDINEITNIIVAGTFIEILYYHFIFINNSEYNFTFLDTFSIFKKYIDKEVFRKISNEPYRLLEDVRLNLKNYPEILDDVSKIFNDYKIVNVKIDTSEQCISLIKNTKIFLINSGDFKLNFKLNLE
tara:strand:+ start:697 stop:1710 length:1014 start_codon:yes stop_codon:yes gene_type:complete